MQLYSVHREMKPTQSFKRFKQDKLTFSNLCLFIPTVLNVYLKSSKDIFCIIKWLFRSYSQITRKQIIRQTFLFFQSVMSIRLNMVKKKKRVLPTRVVWSRDPLMMSSSLESRQPTSWLWPESSTLLPAALLCTRILPSLFNNRKVESLPFPFLPFLSHTTNSIIVIRDCMKPLFFRRDLLPSTTDQVRVCQGKVTHIPLVTWVDLRWVTVEFPRILAQFVRLNVSGLRQKEKLSIQLQPRQESGGKRQKTQVQIRRWEFKLKYNVKPASLMRDETCSALSSWNFLNHQQNNKMTYLWNLM